MLPNPCKGCQLRHNLCHGHCELFTAWKTEQEEFKINNIKQKIMFPNDYIWERGRWMKIK